MALVDDLTLPRFVGDEPPSDTALLWIASDEPPLRAQSWPVLVAIPGGWHEVSQRQAEQINRTVPTALSFVLTAPGGRADESEVAALATAAGPAPAGVERRPSRTPREPRLPRRPRPPRAPRARRTERASRAPRRPRRPRAARPARRSRPPRPRRPRNYKTRQAPGICKGPGCTCWTPGGCIPGDISTDTWFQVNTECYRGPCYSYEACVSGKCQVHPGCVINTILAFWARQYRALPASVQAVVTPVLQAGAVVGRRLLFQPEPPPPPSPISGTPDPNALCQIFHEPFYPGGPPHIRIIRCAELATFTAQGWVLQGTDIRLNA